MTGNGILPTAGNARAKAMYVTKANWRTQLHYLTLANLARFSVAGLECESSVVVTGRLTIPTADGDLLHYSQWHRNYWSQRQKHLLPRLLRPPASEGQWHWRVLGWSCGGITIGGGTGRGNRLRRQQRRIEE